MSKTKQCKYCYKTKPLSEFHAKLNMKDGYSNQCKECRTEYDRKRNHTPRRIKERRESVIKYNEALKEGLRPHRREATRIRTRNYHIIISIINSHGMGKELSVKEKTFIKNFGCSSKVFIEKFERHFQFRENRGMSWKNYGAWTLDHEKPLSKFPLDTEANRKLANHYTNLRPMWGLHNEQKRSKYEVEQTI